MKWYIMIWYKVVYDYIIYIYILAYIQHNGMSHMKIQFLYNINIIFNISFFLIMLQSKFSPQYMWRSVLILNF